MSRPIDAEALEQLFTHLDEVDVPGMGRCWRRDDALLAVCAAPTLPSTEDDAISREELLEVFDAFVETWRRASSGFSHDWGLGFQNALEDARAFIAQAPEIIDGTE